MKRQNDLPCMPVCVCTLCVYYEMGVVAAAHVLAHWLRALGVSGTFEEKGSKVFPEPQLTVQQHPKLYDIISRSFSIFPHMSKNRKHPSQFTVFLTVSGCTMQL